MRIRETAQPDRRHAAACARAGDRLREWRIRRERTQKEVADHIGITQGALSNYETGKRELPLYTALAVAAALDITIGDILDDVTDVIVLEESRLARVVRTLVDRPDVLALLAQMHVGETDRHTQRAMRDAARGVPPSRARPQRRALSVGSPAA